MLRWVSLALCAVLGAGPTQAGSARAEITSARYADPTSRYDHGVLGDAIEYGALEFTLSGGKRLRIVLPDSRVFEDTAPRLIDLDGDGAPEVIVVETDRTRGAQLAIYDETGKITATPYIGRSHRWLAPIGAADLDGDGKIEIAYVDRPHLARLLRVWRFDDRQLTLVAEMTGLTNHRIGQDYISGGLRDCGNGPELITASGDWTRIIATTLKANRLTKRDIGPHQGPETFQNVLACKH